ncbi:MAG: hypothetical protein ACR2FE_12605 [Aeromicrobium sp.]
MCRHRRQRQHRARRRLDPGHRPGPTRRHRHRRTRVAGVARQLGPGDRAARPSQPSAGRLHGFPGLVGLLARDDIEIVAENLDVDPATAALRSAGALDLVTEHRLEALESLATRVHQPGARRIVLRFCSVPTEMLGADHVSGVSVDRTRRHPERRRRIVTGGKPWPGGYVSGWIKRGPTGFIGTDKTCARETADALVDDFNAGLLPTPSGAGLRRPGSRRHPLFVLR